MTGRPCLRFQGWRQAIGIGGLGRSLRAGMENGATSSSPTGLFRILRFPSVRFEILAQSRRETSFSEFKALRGLFFSYHGHKVLLQSVGTGNFGSSPYLLRYKAR